VALPPVGVFSTVKTTTPQNEGNVKVKKILNKIRRAILRRIKATLIALDNLAAALIWGWPGLTVSAQMYRWELKGKSAWPRKLVDRIFWFDPEHCRMSYKNEVSGMRLPRDMRAIFECEGCEQKYGSQIKTANPQEKTCPSKYSPM
jgi:hypothetical protein